MKKLIGITGPSSFSMDMMKAVEKLLNCDFVLLYHNEKSNLEKWVSSCNGIILAGGVDIHPSVYGECVNNGQGLKKFDIDRDKREIFIIREAIKRGKPILGICRGHQLLGIYNGLKLVMDISNGVVCHSPSLNGVSLDTKESCHSVSITDVDYYNERYAVIKQDDLLSDIPGSRTQDSIFVNSFHHQGILFKKADLKSSELKILGTAYVGQNKVEEIVEMMEGNNWMSVQWHPENDWEYNEHSLAVFKRFSKLF